MKASMLNLENLIEGFKLSCQTEGKSPKTIEWYTTFLRRFLSFLQIRSLPTDADHVHKDHIKAFYCISRAKRGLREVGNCYLQLQFRGTCAH